MIREIYEALKAAGVPDEKASAAAEAVAPKGEVATRADTAELRTEFAVLRGELNTLKWMVGFNLAISVALLWEVFAP